MAAKSGKGTGVQRARQPSPPRRAPMTGQPETVRGRVFIRSQTCKGCEFCVTFCPQGVLVMSKEFNPKGYHYPKVVKDECINCTLCLSICPDYAIMSVPIPAGMAPGAPAKGKP